MQPQNKAKEYALLKHVLENTQPGKPAEITAAMDKYGWEKEWFMFLGDCKGEIVDAALGSTTPPPKKLLELGTYLGYSAMRVAQQLPQGAHLHTVEPVPDHAHIARTLIQHAGLSDKVTVVEGTLSMRLDALQAQAPFDFIFIDHDKRHYLADFKILEERGFFHPGTVVVADNLGYPGAPDYVEYIKSHPSFDTVFHETKLEYRHDVADVVGVSVFKGTASKQ